MNLPGWITVIPESADPLSCRCFIIKGNEYSWIFDVGASDRAADTINKTEGKKNVILSHFHQDHTANIPRIEADNIYQGNFTFRHTGKGTAITENTVIEDGYSFRIFPLPCTHSKGSVGLEVNGFAFLGDAAYPAFRDGHYCYNISLLKEEINTLKTVDAEYFVMGHGDDFIRQKDEVTAKLEKIYSGRKPGEVYITTDLF